MKKIRRGKEELKSFERGEWLLQKDIWFNEGVIKRKRGGETGGM